MSIVYLDHAATSWPKPEEVKRAVLDALEHGGNPGRSGHRLSLHAARLVSQARHLVSQLLNAPSSASVAFTLNATDALNMAINGLVRPGDHVITTCFDHNSVLRPLSHLAKQSSIELTVLEAPDGLTVRVGQFEQAIRNNTAMIAVSHASNVTGALLDVQAVSDLCQSHGIKLLLDASQTLGAMPIDVQALRPACLAAPGHKCLFGPQGTGLLYVRPDVELAFWRVGGTGSASHQVWHPEFMPDRLEAGTPNTPGLAGLAAGVEWLLRQGLKQVSKHELGLTERLRAGLQQIPGVTVYGPGGQQGVGVVSVNLAGWDAADLSVALEDDYGIISRPGLHCAPLAHQAIGTFPAGTVRLSVGYSNTAEDVDWAVRALAELSARQA